MKKFILFVLVALSLNYAIAQESPSVTYEYKMFTTVESVVSGGGRSRLISTSADTQTQEKNLENLFSIVGVNFKNIQNNDLVITNKINEFAKEGWELNQTINGVYSSGSSSGIFITRYIFRRRVK